MNKDVTSLSISIYLFVESRIMLTLYDQDALKVDHQIIHSSIFIASSHNDIFGHAMIAGMVYPDGSSFEESEMNHVPLLRCSAK
jgi:hypothetical protein